jgi:MFS family permease
LLAIVVDGLWSDGQGPRRPIIAGAITLAVGSVVAGLANGLVVLIVGRALQGFGGGILIVALYVFIARAFDVDTRPKAFSVLATAWVVPSLVGPLVAGWLAENVS